MVDQHWQHARWAGRDKWTASGTQRTDRAHRSTWRYRQERSQSRQREKDPKYTEPVTPRQKPWRQERCSRLFHRDVEAWFMCRPWSVREHCGQYPEAPISSAGEARTKPTLLSSQSQRFRSYSRTCPLLSSDGTLLSKMTKLARAASSRLRPQAARRLALTFRWLDVFHRS